MATSEACVGRSIDTPPVPAKALRRYLLLATLLAAALYVPVLCAFEWAGKRLNATTSLATIAREQQADPNLLWLGAFRDYAPYKLERLKLVQPEILLVGSSRCAQVRAQMFRPYKTFNACLTAWPLDHVVDFIDRATRISKPRIVVVALDYFLFGDQLANAWRKERTMDYRQNISSHMRKLHDVADFVKRENWNYDVVKTAMMNPVYDSINHNRLTGTEALRGQFGFREDGSITISAGERRNSATTFADVAGLMLSFYGGPHLSEVQFDQIKRLSQLSQDREFAVIAVQFPFAQCAIDVLDQNEYYRAESGPWRELGNPSTTKRLAELGIDFFDLSRDPIGRDQTNFLDPIHLTERGMLKAVLSLLDRDSFRFNFPRIDVALLEADLARNAAP